MPTYTVVGLYDDTTGELYVCSVFEGQQYNVDKARSTEVPLYAGDVELERFLGYFVADDPGQAEQMAREIVGYPYEAENEPAWGAGARRDFITTVKIKGEML